MALAVTLLPQPLSPTSPTSSPGATSKLTRLTAWTVPSCDAKSTVRSVRRRSVLPTAPMPGQSTARSAGRCAAIRRIPLTRARQAGKHGPGVSGSPGKDEDHGIRLHTRLRPAHRRSVRHLPLDAQRVRAVRRRAAAGRPRRHRRRRAERALRRGPRARHGPARPTSRRRSPTSRGRPASRCTASRWRRRACRPCGPASAPPPGTSPASRPASLSGGCSGSPARPSGPRTPSPSARLRRCWRRRAPPPRSARSRSSSGSTATWSWRAVSSSSCRTTTFRYDANEGWDRERAAAALAVLEDLDAELVEQPLPASDAEGMALAQGADAHPAARRRGGPDAGRPRRRGRGLRRRRGQARQGGRHRRRLRSRLRLHRARAARAHRLHDRVEPGHRRGAAARRPRRLRRPGRRACCWQRTRSRASVWTATCSPRPRSRVWGCGRPADR